MQSLNASALGKEAPISRLIPTNSIRGFGRHRRREAVGQVAWIGVAFSRRRRDVPRGRWRGSMIVGSAHRRRDSQRLVSCETVDTVVDALIHSRDATEPRSETTSAAI